MGGELLREGRVSGELLRERMKGLLLSKGRPSGLLPSKGRLNGLLLRCGKQGTLSLTHRNDHRVLLRIGGGGGRETVSSPRPVALRAPRQPGGDDALLLFELQFISPPEVTIWKSGLGLGAARRHLKRDAVGFQRMSSNEK